MKFSVHFCKYFFTLEVNFWPPCVKELGTGGGGLLGAGGTCTGISGGCCCCCCCCIIWNCMNCCAWLLLELKLMRIINYISTINLYNEMLRGEAEFKSLMIAVFDVWCDMLLAARGEAGKVWWYLSNLQRDTGLQSLSWGIAITITTNIRY